MKKMARRALLRIIALFSGWILAILALPRRLWECAYAEEKKEEKGEEEAQEKEVRPPHTPRWGMVIDLDRCTGCGACVIACQLENNVPAATEGPGSRGTEIYWMYLLRTQKEVGLSNIIPRPCMHCQNPPCVKVCPVGATQQSEDGLVTQIYDRCIGCRYCMQACPYSVKYFNWKDVEWPETYRNALNPDVSTRPKGVVEKCTFCAHRIRRAREEARLRKEPMKDADLQKLTACAQACPANAIIFGDLDDPESRASLLSKNNPRAFQLLDYLGTRPKVFYLAQERRKE